MKVPFLLEVPKSFPPPKGFDEWTANLPPEQKNFMRLRAENDARAQWACQTACVAVNIGRVLGFGFVMFIVGLLIGGPSLLLMVQDKLLGK